MPLQATSGAASYDGFGGGVAVEPVYIEQIFSTYLYTGNGSTQTITNGIDLSTKGGLVWTKNRTSTTAGRNNHRLHDSARGVTMSLVSNSTAPEDNLGSASISSFNTDGYSLGGTSFNNASDPWVSWTFRKQPKFFDVVTYTGNGTVKTVNHNLGSVPGVMIVKCTSAAGENWAVYHRSLGATKYLELNNTNAASTSVGSRWDAEPTSTSFSVGYNGSVNSSGETYVAYLFAHDAGGFGLTGTDNVISCGSYNGTGSSTVSVSLGYEPQWVLIKKFSGSTFTDGSASWCIFDNMRGIPTGGSDACLYANLSGAEDSEGTGNFINVTATGFEVPPTGNLTNQASCSYIYIAIRRGPMKVPTDGTKVFAADTDRNATKPGFTSNFPVDFATRLYRLGGGNMRNGSRLTGANHLESNTTAAEAGDSEMTWDYMTGWGNDTGATSVIVSHMFRRAPSFFDEVCYTGGVASDVKHNLQVVPELIIVKNRNLARDWPIYHASLGATKSMILNGTSASYTDGVWLNTAPTTTAFYATGNDANGSGYNFVAYLFATCAGVSKVTSFTGNGSSQTINCGFTAGSRFVMIKRTDSTGDWYVWDSARGIVSGNDPHLSLNSTAAEVTTDDTIDTDSTGFIVNQVSATNCNVNGASYIVLAIA